MHVTIKSDNYTIYVMDDTGVTSCVKHVQITCNTRLTCVVAETDIKRLHSALHEVHAILHDELVVAKLQLREANKAVAELQEEVASLFKDNDKTESATRVRRP